VRNACPPSLRSAITSPKVLPDKMRQQEPVVQFRSPWHERLPVWLIPEFRDERAQEELLDEAHPLVRGHLKGTQLKKSETP